MKEKILFHLAPILLWFFINLTGRTSRMIIIGEEHLNSIKSTGKNVIYTFWHNRSFLIAYALRHRDIMVLVSSSRDGEYVSRTICKFGAGSVRGSTTSGGARALLEMTKKLKSGYDGALSPDGPQGPKYEVKLGVIHLAKRTGLPIVPLVYGTKRKKTLNSWDSYIVPLLFSRSVLIYGPTVEVSPEGGEKELEFKRQELEQILKDITEKADNYFK